MRALIGLTFLLGLASVIKPLKFIGISTRKRGLLVMAAAFGLAAIYVLISHSTNSAGSISSTPTANVASMSPSRSSASTPALSKWEYHQQEDKMRNQSTKYASLDSDNALSFDFPYNGGSMGELVLRNSPKYGKDLMLQISKGQFMCNSYDGCYVHVKFDNQPIVQYEATESSSGRSDVIFIHNYGAFIQHLKQAKKVIIEAEFYQEGWKELEFSPTGLNW